MKKKPLQVIVADEEMIFRDYMEMVFRPLKDYQIKAVLSCAEDALVWCRTGPLPDLVIMDVVMSRGINGLAATREIKKNWPVVKVIIATAMADADWLEKTREGGADSIWLKNYPEQSLPEVMDRTMAGEHVYPKTVPDIMLGNLPVARLNRQQRAILRLLTEGRSNREIAERIFLSPNTVKDYLDDLMEKTGIHSRTALAVRASRLRIVVSEKELATE